MLISKVICEKLADKEMNDIYGGDNCNCLPGCDCTVRMFYPSFDYHMWKWEAIFLR